MINVYRYSLQWLNQVNNQVAGEVDYIHMDEANEEYIYLDLSYVMIPPPDKL